MVIDRPLGSAHPQHPDLVYPVNYGYIPNTEAGDLDPIDAYVLGARRRFGANPIPHKSFLYEVMRRNEEPRAYAMLADQTPLKRTPKHWIRFLNRDTAFFLGPERIARYLDASVVYVAMTRVRRGYYDVTLEVIAQPPYGDDAGKDLRAADVDGERDLAHFSAPVAMPPMK